MKCWHRNLIKIQSNFHTKPSFSSRMKGLKVLTIEIEKILVLLHLSISTFALKSILDKLLVRCVGVAIIIFRTHWKLLNLQGKDWVRRQENIYWTNGQRFSFTLLIVRNIFFWINLWPNWTNKASISELSTILTREYQTNKTYLVAFKTCQCF